MKKLITIAVVAFSVFSCGEAGLGFNIGKEFPLNMPVDFNNFTGLPDVPGFNYNPQAFEVEDSYKLDKVDAFSDDLDNLDEVIINKISYALSGVDPSDEIEVEEMTLELFKNGISLGTITITDDLPGNATDGYQLSDISKNEITTLDLDELSSILKEGGEVGTKARFDFGELPPNDFAFDFTFHFDVIVKIRDL